jgi:hypothetical protein
MRSTSGSCECWKTKWLWMRAPSLGATLGYLGFAHKPSVLNEALDEETHPRGACSAKALGGCCKVLVRSLPTQAAQVPMWQCRVLLDRVPDGRLEAEPQEKSPEARSRREDEEGTCKEKTRTQEQAESARLAEYEKEEEIPSSPL